MDIKKITYNEKLLASNKNTEINLAAHVPAAASFINVRALDPQSAKTSEGSKSA